MVSLTATLLGQLAALSAIEIAAVGFAIAYLLLAIRESIWCWYCAAISTALYVYLFVGARLYMESLLNGFYFAMAVYGWYVWRRGGTPQHRLPVSVWPLRLHLLAWLAIVFLTIGSGALLAEYTDAAFPYVDSLTTFSAIWATFLVARKVLENWWYWLIIDSASVAIYWLRDLPLTALLFIGYVILIPFGLFSWWRSWASQRDAAAAT